MIKALLIIFLLSSIHIRAQVAKRDPEKNKRMLTASFSPGLTYRTLEYSNGEKWIGHYRNKIESPKFGFNANVFCTIPLTACVFGRTGLQFSNHGLRTEKQPLHWAIASPELPESSRTSKSFHQVGVPLELYWNISRKSNINWYAFAGLVPAVLVNTTTVVQTFASGGRSEMARSKSKKLVGHAQFGLSARAGIEGIANVNEHYGIILGLAAQYAITSRYTSSNADEYGYGAFLTIGVARNF